MDTTLLNEREFLETFSAPMREVTEEATNVIDIWPYVASVRVDELKGHQIHDKFVECVYRDATGRFDHVLVMTKTKNVFLTIVVDLFRDRIHGQHLLDLNEKYGLVADGAWFPVCEK